MSNSLANVTNKSIRDALGTRCFDSGLIAIDGTNTENLQTTVAIEHCINGVFQTALATAAEINVSALAVINGDNGEVISAAGATSGATTHPAKASGDDTETIYLMLACKGNVVYVIEQYVTDGAPRNITREDFTLNCPPGYAAFAVVSLIRTAADTATFQFGNDTSAQGDLDQTGRTAAYFNISVLPATLAELVAVLVLPKARLIMVGL